MTEHAPDRLWSSIDIPKTVAGVLAALSAAVIGSFLGVAGTLAGAAVASLIGSVGTEVYHRSINKGRQKLKGTFVTAPAAVGTPPVAAVSPSSPAAPATTSYSSGAQAPRQQIRWRRVALVAGALFVLAIGTLTVAELLSGRSIADATRGGSGDGTTLSSLIRGDESGTPAPESSPSPSPDKTDEKPGPGSSAPAGEDGGTAPTGEATTQPTEEPTTESTDAPAAPEGAGTETQNGADTQNPDKGTE